MSDLGDTGLGATIGAAIVGAIATAREVFARKRRRTDPPELPEDPTLSARVGRLTDRVMHVEQELSAMRQATALKIDNLSESVEELCLARARTDELLPIIREQLKEIREDLRDDRRRAATNKE